MLSETPITGNSHLAPKWFTSPSDSAVEYVWDNSHSDTMVCGTTAGLITDLVVGFDAWAGARDVTPVDREFVRVLRPGLWPALSTDRGAARLLAPAELLVTDNPAADLRSWLSPEIAVPTIAAACGVSERGFYGWLAGGGIRERNARRLHQVRSIVQALVGRLGRERAIEWLLTPNRDLELRLPLDALAGGDQPSVLSLLTNSLSRSDAGVAGPVISEDRTEDFSSYELAATRVNDEYVPRLRRRRLAREASIDETAS